jgi:hypothetical protein
MAEYRKRHDENVWHWCGNCTDFPSSGYTNRLTKPPKDEGELCNACLAKEKKNYCS